MDEMLEDKLNSEKNGNTLTCSILKDSSKYVRLKSVEIIDNTYIDNETEDDVFLTDNNIVYYNSSVDEANSAYYHSDGRAKTSHEMRREMQTSASREARPRRTSDVIDSLGEETVHMRRRSSESGVAMSPGSRTSSDFGYASSPSQQHFVFAQPPQSGCAGNKRVNDLTDSSPYGQPDVDRDDVPEAVMPVQRDAEEYNMNHARRGRAFIFNNDTFDNNLAAHRKGSQIDVDNLTSCFESQGFDVVVWDNLNYQDIKTTLSDLSIEDHTDADCLLIAVLTHGMDNGLLYARDSLYPVEALWKPFTAKNCLTLAGKPKIFFIQACRGEKFDSGVTLVSRKGSTSETDGGSHPSYKIPTYADFLMAYSSINGFYSWRNPEEGTWFIQSVCEELNKNGHTTDFLKMLTRVNRSVALNFTSYNEDMPWLHEKKQISTFYSTLIRDLVLRPKKK